MNPLTARMMARMLAVIFLVIGQCLFSHAQNTGIGSAAEGLKPGDPAPDFLTTDINGNVVQLSGLLWSGKVVLVFFRGEWCRYCNMHMQNLADSIEFITSKGANVIAITPEKGEGPARMYKNIEAQFPIVSDTAYHIMKLYKVAFRVDPKTIRQYKKWNIDIVRANQDEEAILPVPAVYIIGNDMHIEAVWFNPDYTKRANIRWMLDHLD